MMRRKRSNYKKTKDRREREKESRRKRRRTSRGEAIEEKEIKGVVISRYKGLGEMIPNSSGQLQ